MNFFIVVMLNYGLITAVPLSEPPQEHEQLGAEITTMCQNLQHLNSSSEKILISRGKDWLLGKSEADYPNYPDKKYEVAGDDLIDNVLKTMKSLEKLALLLTDDRGAMIQNVYDLVTKQNITAAKRIAGEYNIAANRRYLKFSQKLDKRTDLFMKGFAHRMFNPKWRRSSIQMEQLLKSKQLDENFFKDCYDDEPMVQALRRFFKAGNSFIFAMKTLDSMINDTTNAMLRDFIYLDQDKKDHEGALQRAGESAISWFRQLEAASQNDASRPTGHASRSKNQE